MIFLESGLMIKNLQEVRPVLTFCAFKNVCVLHACAFVCLVWVAGRLIKIWPTVCRVRGDLNAGILGLLLRCCPWPLNRSKKSSYQLLVAFTCQIYRYTIYLSVYLIRIHSELNLQAVKPLSSDYEVTGGLSPQQCFSASHWKLWYF